MRTDYFAVVVIIALGVIVWVIYQVAYNYRQLTRTITDLYEDLKQPPVAPTPPVPVQPPEGDIYQLQRMRDMQRMSDPMIPPIQRGLYPPTERYRLPFYVATQGDYGGFQQVGYASSKRNPDQLFRLMGRQLDSHRYEYYVIHPYTEIKIPTKTKNDWELNTGDRVDIVGFPGEYTVQIYDHDQPRYVPY
jgi:hypothetical protein